MATIRVFDPALCCSTGVCGVDIDEALLRFAADVDWARQHGADIERVNLAQEPLTFAQDTTVSAFLEHSGQEALPLILMRDQVVMAGRSPSRTELARWAHIVEAAATNVGGGGCSGGHCC